MKKYLLAICALALFWSPLEAIAQCTGNMQPGQFCGNPTGSPAPARGALPSAFGIVAGLTSSSSYFVLKTGSDTNCSGLVNVADPGSGALPRACAFITIQKGLNVVGAFVLNGFSSTIQVGAGNYPEALTCPASVGTGTITLQGDTTTPSNVEIGGMAFTSRVITCNNPGNYIFTGFRLTSSNQLVDFSRPAVTVTLGALEFNTVGTAASSQVRASLGAFVAVSGTISLLSVPGAVFNANLGANIVFQAGTPVLNFPAPIGAGIPLFHPTDGGRIQFNTGTTFTNAANWQGIGVSVFGTSYVLGNISLTGFPGGTSIQNDGTGIVIFGISAVTSGVYFPNPVGSLGWIGTNGFLNTIDTSANTAARIYTPPNASTGLAGTSVANAFTAANTFTLPDAAAINVRSGASGSHAQLTIGRTGTEASLYIAKATNDVFTGTAAGDHIHFAATNLWLATNTAGTVFPALKVDTSGIMDAPYGLNLGVLGPSVGNSKLYIGADDSSASIFVERSAGSPSIEFRRANTSLASPSIVASGDAVGDFSWRGYDGTAFRRLAQLLVEVDGTPGASDMPGRIGFLTTPDGSATALRRMTIFNDGGIALANTTTTSPGANAISVNGNVAVNATKTVRASGGAADCTLIFTQGILTGGSC